MITANKTPDTKSLWKDSKNYFMTNTEQCRGCGSLLASKLVNHAIYDAAPNAMIFGRSCGGGRSELQTGGRIGMDGSGMMGVQAAMEVKGVLDDKLLVVMAGEGRALEMGSGDFLASFDREQKLTWIILDNQAYANSGSAGNALTPLKASTRIYSRDTGGKSTPERDMPMMMMFSSARYVATASPAYVKDLVRKVNNALMNQPSYLHIYVPCTVSWRYKPEMVAEISRRMVQTGMINLWEFKEGSFKRTVKVPEQKKRPVNDFLNLQARFNGLSEADIAEIEAGLLKKSNFVDAMEKAFSAE